MIRPWEVGCGERERHKELKVATDFREPEERLPSTADPGFGMNYASLVKREVSLINNGGKAPCSASCMHLPTPATHEICMGFLNVLKD